LGKVECGLEEVFGEIYGGLRDGLLLSSVGKDGEKNIMTIGWGLLGILFGKPAFTVAVRKSRHTYGLLNETGVFTVNVPGDAMEDVLDFCGTRSGRDHDKFRELNLTAMRGMEVEAPIVDECRVHLECRVMAVADMTEEGTSKDVVESVYPSGDYHRIYHGEVLKIYRSV